MFEFLQSFFQFSESNEKEEEEKEKEEEEILDKKEKRKPRNRQINDYKKVKKSVRFMPNLKTKTKKRSRVIL